MKGLPDPVADRISYLPDDVIQRILTLLPVKDAARTATLSTEWQDYWIATPKLVFNGDFGRISTTGAAYALDASKVMMEIYKALLLHEDPITELVLEIPGLTPAVDLDLLMLFLSKKSVQKFAISFSDEVHKGDYPEADREIPSALFSARHLSSLRLKNCGFTAPSWFLGFSTLTVLELDGVYVSSDFWEDFLPECPVLLHLMLFVKDSKSHKAEVVAPSLKVLETNVWNIRFEDTPSLAVVWIAPVCGNYKVRGFRKYNPDIVAVLASLPDIQQLIIGVELLLFLASRKVPFELPAHLHRLEYLELNDIILYKLREARVLFCLIRSCPNLCKLTVMSNGEDGWLPSKAIDSLQTLLEAHDRSAASCFQCLEEFSISEVLGMQVELDLLRFVLASAPVLRWTFIKPGGRLDDRKGHEFFKEVAGYKRASKEAEVSYISKDVIDTF